MECCPAKTLFPPWKILQINSLVSSHHHNEPRLDAFSGWSVCRTPGTSNKQYGGQPRQARWKSHESHTEQERVQKRRKKQGRLLTKICLSLPRLEHPDFVRRLLVRIGPAKTGSIKEIETSHREIGVGGIVFSHHVFRAVDRVWMAEGQGKVLHHRHQRSPNAGFNMLVLQKRGQGKVHT